MQSLWEDEQNTSNSWSYNTAEELQQVLDLETLLYCLPHTPLETHLSLHYEISPLRAQFLHQHSVSLFRSLVETLCKKTNKHNLEEQEKYVP